MIMVKAQNIYVKLNGVEILKGIDLNTDEGSFIGVIGPNGSGKSTFLKCIYRALKPDMGVLFLDGRFLTAYSVKESAKKIGVVAQHNDVGFDFTVWEMAMMGRSPHKKALDRDNDKDRKLVEQALRTVGMESFAERSFATLSGGERQRVILARALAQQTPCLVLDEPTNHLDIKYQLQIMRIVKESRRTVISAIHDLNIAAMFCDYLYVLSNGCVHAHGKPYEVLTEELIWEVYGVRATKINSADGLHIAFRE